MDIEFKHAEGEWAYKYNGASFLVGQKSELNGIVGTICDLKITPYHNLELTAIRKKSQEANAKLIASSPDLLKALISAYDCSGERNYLTKGVLDEMLEAINKATK